LCHGCGQIALIGLELEPVTLREVVWSDLHTHAQVPSTVGGRDTHDDVGLV
jgi:hypothetical protein